jgi:hypothetical protein
MWQGVTEGNLERVLNLLKAEGGTDDRVVSSVNQPCFSEP